MKNKFKLILSINGVNTKHLAKVISRSPLEFKYTESPKQDVIVKVIDKDHVLVNRIGITTMSVNHKEGLLEKPSFVVKLNGSDFKSQAVIKTHKLKVSCELIEVEFNNETEDTNIKYNIGDMNEWNNQQTYYELY